MKVITRKGNLEDVRFDTITDKIKYLSSEDKKWGKKLDVDPVFVSQNVCSLIYNGITTSELDDFW
jgi:ribonucleoside-diphosphate reductase subunit M1